MKLSTPNAKRLALVLLLLPVGAVLLMGPLTGLVGGPIEKTGMIAAEPPSMRAAPQEAPPKDALSAPIFGSEEIPVNEEPGVAGSGFRTVGAMIVVLAMIWISMVRFGPLGHKRRIQVLETVPIGDKRSLTLIQIDGEGLLLASTPTSVSLIKEVRIDESEKTETPEGSGITPSAPVDSVPGPLQKFSDTLAEEIRLSNASIENSLAEFARLRRQIEASS
jgi:flagellar biogenesis protein FliO